MFFLAFLLHSRFFVICECGSFPSVCSGYFNTPHGLWREPPVLALVMRSSYYSWSPIRIGWILCWVRVCCSSIWVWYLANRETKLKFDKAFFSIWWLIGGAFKLKNYYTEKPSIAIFVLLWRKCTGKAKVRFQLIEGNRKQLVGKPLLNYKDDYTPHGFCLNCMYTGILFVLFPSHSTYYVLFIQYRVKKSNFYLLERVCKSLF